MSEKSGVLGLSEASRLRDSKALTGLRSGQGTRRAENPVRAWGSSGPVDIPTGKHPLLYL